MELHPLKKNCQPQILYPPNQVTRTIPSKPNLPTATPGGIENPGSCIHIKEIEFAIKNLSTKKIPGPDAFIVKFYQISKKNNNAYFTQTV